MSNQGIDLKTLKKKNKIFYIKNLDEQIKCIYDTLEKCQIAHLDLNDNGKNICINEKGILSLIDFDIMHFKKLDNIKTLTPLMIQRINRFTYCNNYDLFYQKIHRIIKKCRNIIIINE